MVDSASANAAAAANLRLSMGDLNEAIVDARKRKKEKEEKERIMAAMREVASDYGETTEGQTQAGQIKGKMAGLGIIEPKAFFKGVGEFDKMSMDKQAMLYARDAFATGNPELMKVSKHAFLTLNRIKELEAWGKESGKLKAKKQFGVGPFAPDNGARGFSNIPGIDGARLDGYFRNFTDSNGNQLVKDGKLIIESKEIDGLKLDGEIELSKNILQQINEMERDVDGQWLDEDLTPAQSQAITKVIKNKILAISESALESNSEILSRYASAEERRAQAISLAKNVLANGTDQLFFTSDYEGFKKPREYKLDPISKDLWNRAGQSNEFRTKGFFKEPPPEESKEEPKKNESKKKDVVKSGDDHKKKVIKTNQEIYNVFGETSAIKKGKSLGGNRESVTKKKNAFDKKFKKEKKKFKSIREGL